MAWYNTKQAAADPDNPAANEQIPFSEWNNMVTYLKDKINNKTADLTGLLDDMIMVYDLANDKFVFEAKSIVAVLNDLTDVVISGVPADNEVVAYNTATSKFINQTAAEAGLALVADVVLESDFDATTFLYATANDTPQPKTIAETLAILDVESGADATDATNVNAAGAVMESDFGATSFLYATADNTPLPKTRAETMALLSGTAAAEFLFNTQKVGGIVDPTTAQQAATKNYDDTHLFTKGVTTSFTDGYIPVYRTSSGKFEMEAGGGSAGLPVIDTTAIVKGSGDGTKKMRFEVDYLTTGMTRVMTVPDKDITLCGTDEVMMNPASENLDMADYDIFGIDSLKAHDVLGTNFKDSTGATKMAIASTSYAFSAGAPVNMGSYKIMAVLAGTAASDAIRKDQALLLDGTQAMAAALDMNDNVIVDLKNYAASALSGTKKLIEIDIGGTPYYFEVSPTKA